MIGARDEARAARLRDADSAEADALQAVWESSSAHDDPGGWSRGGWSVATWATRSQVLVLDDQIVGLVGVRAELAPDGAMPAQTALVVSARQPQLAAQLVEGAVKLVREAGATRVRLFGALEADWIQTAARDAGFEPVRTIAHMLLPAAAPSPPVSTVPGLRLRRMRPDEDEDVLAALNRAWVGTWNFVPIRLDMLADDLDGQREGMLVGVDEADRIIATCHAVFEPNEQNPDGNPRAWISNLTVDPEHRRYGFARAMLAAGIADLRARGATSITLGVDADNPAPFALYQSVGFVVASGLRAWDKALT